MEADVVRDQMWQHLLRKGFNQKKLAVFETHDADDIAGQICKDLGVILEQFHVDWVAEWIADAKHAEPVQKRLRGDLSQDPLHVSFLQERRTAEVAASSMFSSSSMSSTHDVIIDVPVRRRNRLEGEVGARSKHESDQKEYWSKELYKELTKIDAPALEHLEHCVDPRHLHLALAGRTRYNTLKRYIKVWKTFLQWVSAVKGYNSFPEIGDLVEYLFSRFDEPCGPTVPGLVVKAVTWFERTACIDVRYRIGESTIVASVRDYITEMLSKDHPPTKRAPRYPVVCMEAFEHMVDDETKRLGYRIVAWIKLVKLWGSLRWDDVQRINPKELKYYSGRMTTILRVTKTTGPSKRVQELPVCISENAFISSPFWLKTGFDLLRQHASFDRDYLLPKLNEGWSGFRRIMATYGDISAYSAKVLRRLMRPGLDIAVIPPIMAAFWTEHSERSTLPTGLALLQTAKDERDMLGRWKPDGSDTYIRMYNGVINRLQLKFAKAARQESRTRLLDERDVIESAMSWITERCELPDEDMLDRIVQHLEESLASPMLSGWHTVEENTAETEETVSGTQDIEDVRTVEPAAVRETRKPMFVVVNSSNKCRRLHKSSGGCWMGREMSFKSSAEFFTMPDPSENDLVDVLRDSFNTDVAQGLESRAQVAAVICSWRETQTKQKRQAEVEAEMDTREWTKPIPTGDYINLRNAFMQVYGKIEDRVTPSKEYLEKKLQELENGEFRAESLTEVVSKDEVDPDVMMPIFDSKGSFSVKRGSTTIPLPTGPEQLRRRLSVMLHAILMLAIKHRNREEIQDVLRDLFERYKDYLLGDYVWGLSSTDLQGHQVQTPPWSLVLSYEQAIRKRAYSLMVTEHVRLGAALEQAWKCPTTKERHFITPLALYSKRWSERKRANWGNTLTDFTYEAFRLQVVVVGGIALFENPEDLGAVKSGEHRGIRPASMWQWGQLEELLSLPHVTTVAFYQQDFGTDYLKPTRLLLGHFGVSHEAFCEGVPAFDDQGFYTGLLEGRTANRQLVGTSTAFATTGTEQWPSAMCKWISTAILQQFVQKYDNPVFADEGAQKSSDRIETDFPVLQPDGNKIHGGIGEPRQCQQPGKERQFHDGAGLSSMGRWDVEQRVWSDGPFWRELRERTMQLILQHLPDERALDRTCFEMAVKGEAGCGLVQDEGLKDSIRRLWIDLLKKHGSTQEGLEYKAEGQPFYLRLMKELLAFGDDCDRDFLLQGETGFPVGVLTPLPRTPHVYEEQTSWKLEDDPYMREEVWRSNYQSVEQHVDFVRQHFAEECDEGLMECLTLEEARARFRRIIHDATHGTKVNNRIRCRDKVRSPSAREKQYLLAYFQKRRKSVFSLVGDISKAHRRFLHAPGERGLLACRVLPSDDFIFINRVGTFGVACASYWWSRIAGCGVRLVHELLGPSMPIELLIFADDVESIASDAGGRRGITLSFLFMSVLGFPFKWSKQRGGLRVEWIGLFTDYPSYRLGLSPKRAAWMRNWVHALATKGVTTSKEFEQGLGRLGFSALALVWERPFLGPLYAWAAATRNKRGALRIPAMLRALLLFLSKRFEEGGELQEAPPLVAPGDGEEKLLFYTDAKATDTGAWIGGFRCDSQGNALEWFSEEVSPKWAEWLTYKKDPKRVIATLELLATLVAVKLWMPTDRKDLQATCWLKGMTDNLSNTFAVSKWMSTKFPLTIFVMELSECLRKGRCFLKLGWVPRDSNQMADDLTNLKFDSF
eukprot:s20_g32.t1